MPDPIPPRNSAMAVAASALQAQQSRMRIIAENIANAQSTAQVAGRRALSASPYTGKNERPSWSYTRLTTGVYGSPAPTRPRTPMRQFFGNFCDASALIT